MAQYSRSLLRQTSYRMAARNTGHEDRFGGVPKGTNLIYITSLASTDKSLSN